MATRVEETGPVERTLRVEVPTADVDAAFEDAYRRFGRRVKVKGFRPGKVPRAVVQRYFAEEVRGEVLERIVAKTLPEALKEEELDLVTEPRLLPGERPSEGKPFSYEANLEVRPEVELGTYKGLQVAAPVLPEPEEDPVEAHLAQLQRTNAPLCEEPEGTRAAAGHVLSVSYQATVEGQVFEGGSAQEMLVELGGGRTLPGFEDQLEGLASGEHKSFELDFPPDYGRTDLAGKRARFEVDVQSVKRRDLPELDDEFAKDVSQFETLEELRAELRRRVEHGREHERERLLHERVIERLVEAHPFPVPQSLVERQLEGRLRRGIEALRQLPEDQLRSLVERWSEEWRPLAERDVRLAFLIPEIARAESIAISDDELDARLAELAQARGTSLASLKREYREHGLIEAFRTSMLEGRVLEFLAAEATLTDA
jgi:trigger factor